MISEEQLSTWECLANEAVEAPLCKNLSEQAYINKNFLIAAREAVPALIAEVRRLCAELDKVSDERSDFGVIGYFQGRSDARDVVRELRESLKREVEHLTISIHERIQLEKEADWIANQAAINCPSQELEEGCAHKMFESNECVKCWREAARKAVQDDK